MRGAPLVLTVMGHQGRTGTIGGLMSILSDLCQVPGISCIALGASLLRRGESRSALGDEALVPQYQAWGYCHPQAPFNRDSL